MTTKCLKEFVSDMKRIFIRISHLHLFDEIFVFGNALILKCIFSAFKKKKKSYANQVRPKKKSIEERVKSLSDSENETEINEGIIINTISQFNSQPNKQQRSCYLYCLMSNRRRMDIFRTIFQLNITV